MEGGSQTSYIVGNGLFSHDNIETMQILGASRRATLPKVPGMDRLTLRKLCFLYQLDPSATPKEIQRLLGCSTSTAYDYHNALRFIRSRQIRTFF